MATSLIDETIVVIGASSGMGLATSKLAGIRGAKVVLVGRDQTKLSNAAKSIPFPADVQTEPMDASSRPALDALFQKLGKVDHLVLAASGGKGAGGFDQVATKDLKDAFDDKFWIYWEAAQSVLPYLTHGGSITFITAASARMALIGSSGLASMNGALNCMVRTIARELAKGMNGTRVNAVSPGVIDTVWWADKPPGMMEGAASAAPLARPGKAEEVADAVLFLVQNRFVTGVVLDVDGGMHLT